MNERDIYLEFINTILDITLSKCCKELKINRTSVSNKNCSTDKLKKLANYLIVQYQMAIIEFNSKRGEYDKKD